MTDSDLIINRVLMSAMRSSIFRYSHVALIDLDEFIIPRHNDTISELLE